jgi:hypothetical protein
MKFSLSNKIDILLRYPSYYRYAFRNSIYNADSLGKALIIKNIMAIFENGSKSELILNVLLYADFSRWK